nr:5'-nucleotidase C-terminal domain-containing protein [Thalassobacillus pellis]
MALLVLGGLNWHTSQVHAADNTKITILHTNDSHGRVKEGTYDGMGFAKLATLVEQKQSENPNTILLDAGDTFHGTPFATLENGSSIVDIMNLLGYNAMAAGNHDFNYGYQRTLELADEAAFPLLSANVRVDATNNQLLQPYYIEEIAGLKIGIFGLSTPETHYKTNPKNVEGLTFTDPVTEAKAMVAELESQDVDMIIALTHLGTDASSTDTSIKVAKEAPGIDLIVDGHSHTVDNIGEGDTLIVSAGEYTKNLGIVELEFDADQQLVLKTADRITKQDAAEVEEDPETKTLISNIEKEQESIMNQVVGKSSVNLNGERADVRTSETNLGNLITNAMLEKSGADIAITNGGGIRASIGEGEVTLGEIINVSPFGNYLVKMKMSGATIKEALEHGVSDYPNTKGAFPQVGGMTFTIDSKASAGKRVKDLRVSGEPIDLEATYLVATNDFLAAGGDDYSMFAEAELVTEYEALEEIMKEYINVNSPVNIGDENRINILLPFSDVNRDDWGFDYIERLYGHGVINGMTPEMFGIDHTLTRVQFAAMLVRGLGLTATTEAPFTDLEKASEEMQVEISAAFEAGLIKGHEDNTFRPHEAVKRYEMALMIKRAYEYKVSEPVNNDIKLSFEDIEQVDAETLEAIKYVNVLGFMEGHNSTTFEPYGDATREQSAKVIDLYLHAVGY